jgi:tetratricopeptide (TPR) repeat protein
MNRFNDAFIELKIAFKDPNLSIDKKVSIVLSFFPQFEDAKARANANELSAILASTHPDEPKAFAVYGDVLFQEQKYPQASEAYRKALKLNDQVYQIWEQLIRIEIDQGNYQQAITDGDIALTIFPNQAALYMYTGIAYAQAKKHEKAISHLKNAASLQLENTEEMGQIYSALGDSYNALKRYSESDQAYDKALELVPGDSYTLNNYAYYLSLRGENLDKAEKMSKKSNELDPDKASSQDTYAWILFRLKKYQDAQVWIEKALHNNKSSATLIEHYGDILFHVGDKQQAFEQWRKAKAAGAKSEKLDQKINEKKYVE